ncbi:MAG TPA: hypothetical protein VHB27_07675, partial [Rhodopila sp.]|uniref:hypothetical protein n=1 Tax=Rhodopila sp. TaxID=2480087 RepID=UPI002B562E02
MNHNLTAPPPRSGRPPPPERASAPRSWEEMYGLSASPFEGDSAFITFPSHRQAFERVVRHLLRGDGALLLLGEPGIGKSILLRAATEAAIQAGLPPGCIIRISDGRQTQAVYPSDARWVAVVDNADPRHLGELRSSIEAACAVIAINAEDAVAEQPPMGQLPMGQPTVNQPGLTWLRLPPLSQSEMEAYIERRLWTAGGTVRRLITPDALTLVLQQARGVPGTANRLMEAVLTAGFIRGDPMIAR